MGLVINRPKDELTLGDVLDHLGIAAAPEMAPVTVLDGGPVRPDRGFVLHSEDFTAADDATQDVCPGIRLTATRDVLEAVAGENAPERFVLALGCSGWGAGQLEDELKQNAWLVVDADDAIIFGDEHEDKWARASATDVRRAEGWGGRSGWRRSRQRRRAALSFHLRSSCSSSG